MKKQKRFTEKEKIFIFDNYKTMSNPDIAKKLGRTTGVIQGFANYNNLRKDKKDAIKINMKYNMLTVIHLDKIKSKEKKRSYYVCKCDCGGFSKPIEGAKIKNGSAKSCGCRSFIGIKRKLNRSFGETIRRKLLSNYKCNAKKRKLSFNLNEEDFFYMTKEKCFYCNKEPSRILYRKGYNETYTFNGIDRLNNNIGYEKTNCVPCCTFCNRQKGAMNKDDFLDWVKRVYKACFGY